jgi:glycosyltransferase EpsD
LDRQKKILFVANVAKEHINKFHIPTIREFKKNGWIVDVACSGDDDVPECSHHYKMCWKRSPFTFKTVSGIKQLRNLINSEHYDVIYCHTPVGGLIARLAASKARKNGTKVIYCAHGLHLFKGAPIINWLVYYPLEKFLAHYTDAIFTVNEEDFNRVKAKFTKKVKVLLVPEVGVNFDRLNIEFPDEVRETYRKKMGISDGTTALIYVAELLPNKNQKMLVDTLNLLLKRGQDVCLVLPGPDHANGALSDYIESQGLSHTVKLLGWRSDVGELLYACDICTASSIREGFGINLVEAMYCGLPVVATNNRGHRMIIDDGKNGFLVQINDVKGMAKKVSDLISDKTTYDRLKHVDVKKYSSSLIANYIYCLINEKYT